MAVQVRTICKPGSVMNNIRCVDEPQWLLPYDFNTLWGRDMALTRSFSSEWKWNIGRSTGERMNNGLGKMVQREVASDHVTKSTITSSASLCLKCQSDSD